jgi:glucose/arabinose dehydrogenase
MLARLFISTSKESTMRPTLSLLLGALLLTACAASPKPPPQAAAPQPAPAAEPPPAKQNETPPTPPKAKKTLGMKIPAGWARIPPGMVGAPEEIDAVLMNPPTKGMILVDIYETREKSAAQEAEATRMAVLQNKGVKAGKVETSADGNLAWFTWQSPNAEEGKPARGKVAVRHIPKTEGTADVTVELLGMWGKEGNKENAAALDEAIASFSWQ